LLIVNKNTESEEKKIVGKNNVYEEFGAISYGF
jgi:hypothetical protein